MSRGRGRRGGALVAGRAARPRRAPASSTSGAIPEWAGEAPPLPDAGEIGEVALNALAEVSVRMRFDRRWPERFLDLANLHDELIDRGVPELGGARPMDYRQYLAERIAEAALLLVVRERPGISREDLVQAAYDGLSITRVPIRRSSFERALDLAAGSHMGAREPPPVAMDAQGGFHPTQGIDRWIAFGGLSITRSSPLRLRLRS